MVLLVGALSGGVAAGSDDLWLQWRGPERDGTVRGDHWPESLESLEAVWRVDLDKGYPGPIVGADRVFVAETRDGTTEIVRALDRESGEEIWQASWPGDGSVPFFAARNGDWIRSTPAFDGESLFVGGMNEVLVSLDGESGRENWRVDFPQRFGTGIPDFGFSSSPLIDGDSLYVQAANSLVKIDKASGETVWRALATDADIMASGAFSSPVFATISGRRQLLVQTRHTLHGIDPESGEVLWSHDVPSFRGMNILTPTAFDQGVLTSSHKYGTFYYSVEESGDGWSARESWTYKGQAYMSSPVVVDDHAYLHLGNGRLTCLNLRTGEATWTSLPMGKYWSMAVQGDKILALNEAGTLYLLRANPAELEILDSREVSSQETWGHIAVSGEGIFVRELKGIAAFRWPSADGSPGSGTPGR